MGPGPTMGVAPLLIQLLDRRSMVRDHPDTLKPTSFLIVVPVGWFQTFTWEIAGSHQTTILKVDVWGYQDYINQFSRNRFPQPVAISILI